MKLRPLTATALVIIAVVGLSALSVLLWGDRPERAAKPDFSIPSTAVTAAEIIRTHNLPPKLVLAALDIDSTRARSRTLADLGFSTGEAQARIITALLKYEEERSKNWLKIAVKFLLWLALLPIPFMLLRRRALTPRRRLLLLASGVVLFGIALGADPSPMGTVKDAVYLVAAHDTVFVPRLIALSLFLLTVVVANKFICSWGCQFGLLQDFLFRLNRSRFDRKGILRQYKLPFWLTNSIRVASFVTFTTVACFWAFDLIGAVDPFKIFNPAVITGIGIAFLVLLLVASLFVYRPWCHLACPFGLVSWLFEKVSVFRIRVNYRKCDACNLCARACPSNVMEAVLTQNKRAIPDCFSCGTCIDVCPQDAIRFSPGRQSEGSWSDSLVRRDVKRAAKRVRTAPESENA